MRNKKTTDNRYWAKKRFMFNETLYLISNSVLASNLEIRNPFLPQYNLLYLKKITII